MISTLLGRHRRRRLDANRLTGQRALAEKVAGRQHRDDRLFADAGEHRELDRALLDVSDVVGRVALREDDLSPPILHDRSCRACRLEIRLRIERVRRVGFRFANVACPWSIRIVADILSHARDATRLPRCRSI